MLNYASVLSHHSLVVGGEASKCCGLLAGSALASVMLT